MQVYDYLILGTGSGMILASSFLERKEKVAIVEKSLFGGTCLNRGCIPSKRLIHVADIAHTFQNLSTFQIEAKEVTLNFKKLIQETNQMVHEQAFSMEEYYTHSHIDVFPHEGRFIGHNQLEVAGKVIEAKKILLDIGSIPRIPMIEGLSDTPFLTSDKALQLEKLPSHIVILGGGYIGMEMAYFYSALGSKVTVIEKGKILEREDREIVDIVKDGLGKRVTFLEEITIERISYQNKEFTLSCQEGKKLTCDQLLVATGRVPPTKSLQLEKTGIELGEKGFIKVDEYLQTTAKNVWALGDCIHPIQLKHLANYEAKYLKRLLLEESRAPITYPPIPYAIFTLPTIATVGQVDNETPYYERKANYQETGKGWFLEERGLLKLRFATDDRRLLSATIAGKNAEEIIHILAIAIEKKLKEEDLKRMIFIHPTLSEVIPSALSD